MRSTPAMYASGIEKRTTARMASAQMSNGRRRRRSTHAPAKSPTRSTARLAATIRSAICSGPAPSTRSATSGTAVRVTTDPSSETVWPAHSFLKSALRQSDAFSTLVSLAPAHGRPRRRAAEPRDVIDPRHGDVENATVVSGSQQVALLRALVVSERTLLEHPLYAADARAIIQDAEREMAALG